MIASITVTKNWQNAVKKNKIKPTALKKKIFISFFFLANKTFVCNPETHFECRNKICVEEYLLCNGQDDCGDFSDEIKCNINECHQDPPPCSHICIDKKVG